MLGAGDQAALHRVADGVFDHPLAPERLREFLSDPRHHLAVAMRDGEIIGFVSSVHYLHPDKPSPELWINEVAVAPGAQRAGIGHALMCATLDNARSLDCAVAWVLTDRANTGAMALYAAAGGNKPSDQLMIEFDLDEGPNARHEAT